MLQTNNRSITLTNCSSNSYWVKGKQLCISPPLEISDCTWYHYGNQRSLISILDDPWPVPAPCIPIIVPTYLQAYHTRNSMGHLSPENEHWCITERGANINVLCMHPGELGSYLSVPPGENIFWSPYLGVVHVRNISVTYTEYQHWHSGQGAVRWSSMNWVCCSLLSRCQAVHRILTNIHVVMYIF